MKTIYSKTHVLYPALRKARSFLEKKNRHIFFFKYSLKKNQFLFFFRNSSSLSIKFKIKFCYFFSLLYDTGQYIFPNHHLKTWTWERVRECGVNGGEGSCTYPLLLTPAPIWPHFPYSMRPSFQSKWKFEKEYYRMRYI